MKKIKKLIGAIFLAFVFLGTGVAGVLFAGNDSNKYTNADFSNYDSVSNDLPDYFKIDYSKDANTAVGYVGNTIYLFQTDSFKEIKIATDEIVVDAVNDKTNYAYVPDMENPDEPDEYYYFDFQNSLSLYYNLTNEQIANGATGVNLIQSQSIENYTKPNGKAIPPANYNFTPSQLDIKFKLDTSKNTISFGSGDNKNNIILANEGCYTLVVPLVYYYTNNGGATFTSAEKLIYYTFMVFKSNTYFDALNGFQNLTPSENLQISSTTSTTFSRYYFYNYAYATSVNTLPSITYDPNVYQIRVDFTDVDETSHTSVIEYSALNDKITQKDENGNELTPEDSFVWAVTKDGKVTLYFRDLGTYDFSFIYLYKSINALEQTEITYTLPLNQLVSSSTTPSIFKNKNQRLFVYGYQAKFSDYSNVDELTNQPVAKELKSFDYKNGIYTLSADITSGLNSFIKTKQDADSTQYPNIDVSAVNPSSSAGYANSVLKEVVESYINKKDTSGSFVVNPVSTNQTPVKFFNNVNLQSASSHWYKVIEKKPYSQVTEYKDTATYYEYNNSTNTYSVADPQPTSDNFTEETYYIIETNKQLSDETTFEGFNQNNAGTYVYIIQYTYDSFLSENGTLQASNYHYQVFYFTVTSSIPKVTILDENFDDVYTSSFTNKSVYVLNDAANNIYDAKVTILLSAKNYNTGNYYFQDIDITKLSNFGISYRKFEESGSNDNYNKFVAGKYGILINKNEPYANANYTVEIYSANTSKPSVKTFTIDTNEVTGIKARNVSVSSSNTYKIEDDLSSYNTNCPIIFSWNEKASGASTYAYVKYLPLTQINYYLQSSQQRSLLLYYLINSNKTLPVSYKLDFSLMSDWNEYKNTVDATSVINANYVKSEQGLYILEVYDQAGNSSFEIFMIDKTKPVFVLNHASPSDDFRDIMPSSKVISVPDAETTVSVEWAEKKAFYLANLNLIGGLKAYPYSVDADKADEKLQTIVSDFFDATLNNSLQTFNNVGAFDTTGTGISNYNGTYLTIAIDNNAYIKSANPAEPALYKGNLVNASSYKITFLNGEEAIEGTYKIFLRDASNNKLTDAKTDTKYKNASSGYVSFNVTSDATEMMVKFDDVDQTYLSWSDFSLPGSFYQKGSDTDDDGIVDTYEYQYAQQDGYTHDGPTYKFAYYTPITATKKIFLSFIPIPLNGAALESVVLKYYPFVKSNAGNYYTISDQEEKTIEIYSYNSSSTPAGETETFEISFGGSQYPKAGRYVIVRDYNSTTGIDQYDYYRRTISFTVDDFGLISPLESVSEGSNQSLESLVGRDIALSMYSDQIGSGIEIAFPKSIGNDITSGSFYTKEIFDQSDNPISVEGNKLPMTLYIPQYKYTIGPGKRTSDYFVNPNNALSYYGDGQLVENNDGTCDVVIDGVVTNFSGKTKALNYLNTASIRQYEIYAEITAKVQGQSGIITKYYASDNSVSSGYLKLFETGKNFEVTNSSTEVRYFYQPGDYVVTIYQASNDGETSDLYKLYKFGFRILSSEPEFDIINEDGYSLTETSQKNIYYTNSKKLTVQWEIPQSDYIAQIDETEIYVSGTRISAGNIKTNNNIKYFELDCSSQVENQGQITITMQYQGYNNAYYNTIRKTVNFDISAPLANLNDLMTKTQGATNNTFRLEYQQIYMRSYRDYNNNHVEVNGRTDLSKLSYSYSSETEPFKYYSYNVTKDFFTGTLLNLYRQASQHLYDTQFIYFKEINSINTYQQTDKNSFSQNNYIHVNEDFADDINSGNLDIKKDCYYEVVELDYAGNMVVYVVYVINDTSLNNAISYKNYLGEDIAVKDDEIANGLNLYFTSDFKIENINYLSDPWEVFFVEISGQTQKMYMRSPWIGTNNNIYEVSLTTSGIQLKQVTLSSVFENISSSSNKHNLLLTDRITGTNKTVYFSVMDAILNSIKVPSNTHAILQISTPTVEEQASTTKAYIYPVKVNISRFNSSGNEDNKWIEIMQAEQLTYGTWTSERYAADLGKSINFEQVSSPQSALQISIALGANNAPKFKYEITDNFGKKTIVIQLAREVSFNEIDGPSVIYPLVESDGNITYISDDYMVYSFNTQLHSVEIYDIYDQDITSTISTSFDSTKGLQYYTFTKPTSNQFDVVYKIVVKDAEEDEEIKTLHLRLYHKLPFVSGERNDVNNGAIVFNDKNQVTIQPSTFEIVPSKTVIFDGKEYTSSVKNITTYSQNVTLFYPDGRFDRTGTKHYQDQYGYTVYLSRDNGLTWENINTDTSHTTGYTISGIGEYLVFIRYNTDEVLENVFSIYGINILDSSASYYYITVDGSRVNRSEMKYKDGNNIEYQTNYIVGIDIDDKANRLAIVPNEELGVECELVRTEITGTNVYVEIYSYRCPESTGMFTIIYIYVGPSDSIVSMFTYETSSGATNSLKSSTSEFIAANKETESNFTKLKLNFSAYYGIEQNKIKIGVQKLFNGAYVDIYPTIYQNGNNAYIYLTRSGSYRLRLNDSCTPSHSQYFKSSDYVDLIFLNSTPITVNYTNVDDEEVVSEFVQKAVYNSSVKISLNNLTTYYQPSGYPVITVKRNGVEYGRAASSDYGYIESNNQYTFSQPGYYSVIFSATSTTGIQLREEEFNFTIINKNESRYAYEFANYDKYYVLKVIKDEVDITEDLKEISNFNEITINNKTYMTNMLINFLDEKTGGGRYRVTISPNDPAYVNTIGNEFTFDFWINMANPPITVSLAEGESTTKNIAITFNTRNLYNAVGDCYLVIGGTTRYYTSENISSYNEIETITLSANGTYFIQLYTSGGHLLYSYKITKNEPLNAFAIISIIIAIAVVAAVVVITIKLRKRQKTK